MLDEWSKKRVLLIEDNELYINQVSRNLRRRGYEVVNVKTVDDALKLLYTGHFHIAIVDMWLNEDLGPQSGQDEHGPEILKIIMNGCLANSITRIVMTHYPTQDHLQRNFDWNLYRFINKYQTNQGQDDYITTLTSAIEQTYGRTMNAEDRLVKRVYHNSRPDIRLVGSSEQTISDVARYIFREEGDKLTDNQEYNAMSARLGDPLKVTPEMLEAQVYDLICKSFLDYERINVLPLTEGLTGASVVRVVPSLSTGDLGRRYVLKIGRRDKIVREYERYQKYVSNNFTAGAVTAVKFEVTRNLGAIRYHFAENDSGAQLIEFDALYEDSLIPPKIIADSLRMLFMRTFRMLQQNRKQIELDIVEDYYQSFELVEKGRLQRIIDAVEEMNDYPDLQRYILNPEPNGSNNFINPITWLQRNRARGNIAGYITVTHGDLTGRNIMADRFVQNMQLNGQTVTFHKLWVIDFYRTGESHILRDHVVLETHIKYYLMPELSTSEFWQLENYLMGLKPVPADLAATNPTMHRAYEVLKELRQLSIEIRASTSEIDRDIEFYFALLMATLNVVRLKHIAAKRKFQAILSASLICAQLDYLVTGYRRYPTLDTAPNATRRVQEQFSQELQVKSSPELRYIVNQIRNQRTILFVGRRGGDDPTYPTPYALSRHLLERMDMDINTAANHREVASLYLKKHPNRGNLLNIYKEYFKNAPRPEVFSLIAQRDFAWKAIFTTQQHTYLEDAFKQGNIPYSKVAQLSDLPNIRPNTIPIYKLYGSLDDPYSANCPLVEQDYLRPDDMNRVKQMQDIIRHHLQQGLDLVMLYPSSDDLRIVDRWYREEQRPTSAVWIIAKNLNHFDLQRVNDAGMKHIDQFPTDTFRTLMYING